MAATLWCFVLLSLAHISWCQLNSTLPIRIPPTASKESNCLSPAYAELNAERNLVKNFLRKYGVGLPCSCGGAGGWTRVAYLNMSDPNQQCPSNWNLTTTPVRGCGRSSTANDTCDSVFYPVNGRTYSSVCGRVNAIQRGSSLAFNNFSSQYVGINSAYVSGVSLTHGPSYARQHIWSFAGAMSRQNALYSSYNCPCSNTNITWPHQIPPFVGNDYFCDTGSPYFEYWLVFGTYFIDDPLWDGEGCGSYSTCCSFNTPPWFCKSLPQPTRDDLEIRLCSKYPSSLADKLITLIDVYIH